MERNNVIRIKCADEKGLIARIAGVLFTNQHNIIVMKEFVETATNTFFMRLEISGNVNELKLKNASGVSHDPLTVARLPRMSNATSSLRLPSRS